MATLLCLWLIIWSKRGDLYIRIAGLLFQVVGIGVALYVLQDVRTKLDQPSIGAALTAFLEPPNGQSANVTGEGAILGASTSDTTEAHGTLTTHPKSLSTDDRFTALEDQVASLEARHAADISALQRMARDDAQLEAGRYQEQIAGVKNVRDLLVDLQTNGLALALFGIIWLVVGAVFTSVPDLVKRGVEYLHHGNKKGRSSSTFYLQ